ncbi:hypothetical protein EVAR_24855_1 [Eumeta japonica]|uniref:Uncharacterized protein n=1 Tax=Eumeta variegata TaxID=151549 RepID=A0A4C1YCT7_EUMVA|nr:hypothetical protein EVAR_24855_1 [Eumeta japonica]
MDLFIPFPLYEERRSVYGRTSSARRSSEAEAVNRVTARFGSVSGAGSGTRQLIPAVDGGVRESPGASRGPLSATSDSARRSPAPGVGRDAVTLTRVLLVYAGDWS